MPMSIAKISKDGRPLSLRLVQGVSTSLVWELLKYSADIESSVGTWNVIALFVSIIVTRTIAYGFFLKVQADFMLTATDLQCYTGLHSMPMAR